MQSELQKHLSEATRILEQARTTPLEKSKRIERAILLTTAILNASNLVMTHKEKSFGKILSRMMKDPYGKIFTVDATDQSFRSHSNKRAANQLCYLLDQYGIPEFFNALQKTGVAIFKALGTFLPNLFVPLAKKLIRHETSRVILQGEEKEWLEHLRKRKQEGIRVNLNHLGEAILGEEEASSRVNRYLQDLEKPEVDYISVKASTLYSQIHPIAWKETLQKLAVPYRELLRRAKAHPFIAKDGERKPKFVNLDMEEYKDLRLTVDLFKEVLNEPEFANTSAGIVLQSYLPDSYAILQELTAYSKERVAKGSPPIKVRIVKGANLAMEKVEASIKGWEQAPYAHKADVDANFKKMVEFALTKENAQAVHIGIGSHNLFDIAYAMLLREEQGIQKQVVFEMLEGMADASRKVIQLITNEMLLYCPAASPEEFQNAVAYLVRRLDENTMAENFLRVSFGLKPGTKSWQHQADLFALACQEAKNVSTVPRRRQNRLEEKDEFLSDVFENVADTDWALSQNRTWAENILNDWKSREKPIVPAVIAGDEFSHPQIEEPLISVHKANSEEVKKALDCLPNAQMRWSHTSTEARLEILSRTAQNFRKNRGELLGAMLWETSKPFLEGDPEVSEAIDFIEYYKFSLWNLEGLKDVKFRSKGPVLVASPWNFPCSIPTGGISAALAVGNAVIFKPAPEAALVGYQVAKLFWDAGVPKDVLQFIPCRDEEASALVMDSRIAFAVLTGATDTAKLFLKMRPDIDLAAETGGKNAIIVTALSDRDLAVKDVVQSAFGFSGQKCSACSLLILEEEVYDDPKFKKQLKDAVESLKVGSSWNPDIKVNPLIKAPAGALLKAIQEEVPGEEWLVRPKVDPQNAQMLSPGIKWGVKPGSYLHLTELFGPVLSVMKAKDLEEAVKIVNQTPYGLTSGIHSLDVREQNEWVRTIEAGNCYINRGITGAIVERQPFGGCKASSFGRGLKAGGPNYLMQFMRCEQVDLPGYYAPVADEIKSLSAQARLNDEDIQTFVASAGSYAFFYLHYFSHDHDPMKVLGQDNIQRYVPISEIALRISEDDSDLDVLRVVAAAKTVGASIQCSLGSQRNSLQFLKPIVEDSKTFVDRSRNKKIRLLSKPDAAFYDELSKAGIPAVVEPVMANGRIELLHYLRELSISKDYHRYGNLGAREYDTRKPGCITHCQGVGDAHQNTCCRC